MKLEHIAWKKERRLDGCEMGMGHFLSLLQENLRVELSEKGMEQVRQVLQEDIGTTFYAERMNMVDHTFRGVFVEKSGWLVPEQSKLYAEDFGVARK